MKITPYHYIAFNNKKGAINKLRNHGIDINTLSNNNDIADKLYLAEKNIGDTFTESLIEIHPDYLLFEEYFNKKTKEIKANDKTLKIEGEAPTKTEVINNKNNDLLLGVALSLSIASLLLTTNLILKK